MSRSRHTAIVLLAALLVGCQTVPATQPASTQPAAPRFRLSQVQTKEVPRMWLLSVRTTTTYADMGKFLDQVLPEFEKIESKLELDPACPHYVLIYRHGSEDPNRPFDLMVGLPVKEGTRPPATGRFNLRLLEPYRCAYTEYTGPMSHIDRAYAHIFDAVGRSGVAVQYEYREVYLKWEKPDSPHNVTEVQVGVRPIQ